MAAGAGVAPAFAPSKGAVLRLDDPALAKRRWKMENGRWRGALAFAIFNILSSILAAKKWPAGVTLPVLRIKSSLHHFNACGPFALTHYRCSERRMAECRGLAPLAFLRHALVSTEARFACPVDIPFQIAVARRPRRMRRTEDGVARFAIFNPQFSILAAKGWSAWQDLHLQPFRLERNVSSNWTTRSAEP
jgi:hypothetical protein